MHTGTPDGWFFLLKATSILEILYCAMNKNISEKYFDGISLPNEAVV
jgi:hypothetical protein